MRLLWDVFYLQGLGKLLQDSGLAPTKARLTLHIEYPGYIRAGSALDFSVRVDKSDIKQVCQMLAYGGLARAHWTNQKKPQCFGLPRHRQIFNSPTPQKEF